MSRGVCSPRPQMSEKTDTMFAVTFHRSSGGTLWRGLRPMTCEREAGCQ